MGNSIVKDQNSTHCKILLQAQWVAYNKAKETKVFEHLILFLTLCTPFVLLSTALLNKNIIIGLLVFLLVLFSIIVEKMYAGYTTIAAKIQEEFDTLIFNLPWNKIFVGERINIEKIKQLSLEKNSVDTHNWYSANITAQVEENIAIVICQRINLFWDSELRQKWVNLLIIFTAFYYAIFFLIGIFSELTFYVIIESLIPTILFIRYIYNQVNLNNKVIIEKNELLTRLKVQLENYKNSGKIVNKSELRQSQDVIYKLRKSYQKTPNWFYNRYKTNFENTIDISVIEIINAFNKK